MPTPAVEHLLVTVGSTDFSALVAAADELAPSLARSGICQIGEGVYEPKNLPWFRFCDSLEPHFDRASLVLSHGGLATVMEVLHRGLPLVAVANPDRYDDHQRDLLARLEAESHLVWCRQLDHLRQSLQQALAAETQPYPQPHCEIHLRVAAFLRPLEERRHQRRTRTGQGRKPKSSKR